MSCARCCGMPTSGAVRAMLDYLELPPGELARIQLRQMPDARRELSGAALAAAQGSIMEHLERQRAAMVAHYYTDPLVQELAEESGGFVGDSLEMARFGASADGDTLVVCGVRFMGESAKMLSPHKRVLMPDLAATCSLDLGCPADAFGDWCDAHPERTVVVYANTSAAVKARADWVVTSSIAMEVVEHLDAEGHAILWAPDKYLGDYVRRRTDADMLIWDGSCVVHEEFKHRGLLQMKALHPEAAVLAHPESPAAVLRDADVVGSTSQLIAAAARVPQRKLIVATDRGIFHKMQQAAPSKELIIAPTAGPGASCRSCARCPWMAMNSLDALERMLRHPDDNEILVDEDIAAAARRSLDRMLEFQAA